MNVRSASSEARVDLDAIRANVTRLREVAGRAEVMAVVKADAYGHGMLPCARAAKQAGASWLGAALPGEALALRAAGVEGRLLCWLYAPGGTDWRPLLAADVDLSVSARWALDEIAAAARRSGSPARIHLKVDTGLGRNGAQPHEWPELVDAALKAEADGLVRIVGVWSHLACADWPRHPSVRAQQAAFGDALEVAERAGARPEIRHLANSPATLLLPETRLDLVRVGIACYGISPAPEEGSAADFGLRPAMTLAARLASVKRVPAGHGVSYGHRYRTSEDTRLGLVPLGYADGVPRAAGNAAPVLVGGQRRRIAGVVAMDQFVVDLGPEPPADGPGAPPVAAGDEVLLFGPGDQGEPTAQDWADALDTIAYEVVTRIGARVPRRYLDSTDGGRHDAGSSPDASASVATPTSNQEPRGEGGPV
jgi:alanine racemase